MIQNYQSQENYFQTSQFYTIFNSCHTQLIGAATKITQVMMYVSWHLVSIDTKYTYLPQTLQHTGPDNHRLLIIGSTRLASLFINIHVCSQNYWSSLIVLWIQGVARHWGEGPCDLPPRTLELMLASLAPLEPEFIMYAGKYSDTIPTYFFIFLFIILFYFFIFLLLFFFKF